MTTVTRLPWWVVVPPERIEADDDPRLAGARRAYSPDQARDEHGRWADEGGGSVDFGEALGGRIRDEENSKRVHAALRDTFPNIREVLVHGEVSERGLDATLSRLNALGREHPAVAQHLASVSIDDRFDRDFRGMVDYPAVGDVKEGVGLYLSARNVNEDVHQGQRVLAVVDPSRDGTVNHEFGHIVHLAAAAKADGDDRINIGRMGDIYRVLGETSRDPIAQAVDRLDGEYDDNSHLIPGSGLSDYSSATIMETFAEAFSASLMEGGPPAEHADDVRLIVDHVTAIANGQPLPERPRGRTAGVTPSGVDPRWGRGLPDVFGPDFVVADTAEGPVYSRSEVIRRFGARITSAARRAYSPDQARDERGRWADDGGGDGPPVTDALADWRMGGSQEIGAHAADYVRGDGYIQHNRGVSGQEIYPGDDELDRARRAEAEVLVDAVRASDPAPMPLTHMDGPRTPADLEASGYQPGNVLTFGLLSTAPVGEPTAYTPPRPDGDLLPTYLRVDAETPALSVESLTAPGAPYRNEREWLVSGRFTVTDVEREGDTWQVGLRYEGPAARVAYSPEQPRDDLGRWTSDGGGDDGDVEITGVPETTPEGRGPTQQVQMIAAIAENLMKDAGAEVTGPKLKKADGEALVDRLMEKYAPGVDYQSHWGSKYVNEHASAETGAFASRGMTELLPEDDPMYGKDVAILGFRTNSTPITVIHEVAHVVEGSWKIKGLADDGHTYDWFRTYHNMLGDEGFTVAQNYLRTVGWDPNAEDEG